MNNLLLLFKLLENNTKFKLVLIFIAILIGTFFETLSIGLIIPLITSITNYDLLIEYFAKYNLNFFLELSHKNLIIIFSSILLIVYIIKNLILYLILYLQQNFSWTIQRNLSNTLFKKYLRQDFSFYLNNNSSNLIRNITVEIQQLNGIIFSAGILITEIFIIIGLGSVLLLIDFNSALAVSLLILILSLIYSKFTKSFLINLGEVRQKSEGEKIKILNQAFLGIKEWIVFNSRNLFLKNFKIPNFESTKSGMYQTILQGLPRLWLELIAILSLTSIIIVSILSQKNIENLMTSLAVFIAASFRLLPSITRILGSLQTLRYTNAVTKLLIKDLKLDEKFRSINENYKANFSKIEFKNVSFKYNESDDFVIKNFSYTFNSGDSIGIIGPSGTGKSTFINLLLNLVKPSIGSIYIDGVDLKDIHFNWHNLIGYVPQDIFLIDGSIKSNIAIGQDDENIDEKKILKLLKKLNLFEFIDKNNGINTSVGERGLKISGGQKQRIGIARALYRDPRILIFDEATSSLDIENEKKIIEIIKGISDGITSFIVSHKKSTIVNCKKIINVSETK